MGTGATILNDTNNNKINKNINNNNKSKTNLAFSITLQKFDFTSRAISTLHHTISERMIIRKPSLANILKERLNSLELWLGMRLKMILPKVLAVIFDDDAIMAYERLFTVLFKVNLIYSIFFQYYIF